MPGGNVLLELLVPRRRIELREPIAESHQLLAGELADRGLDLVDGAHVWRINRSALRASAEAWPENNETVLNMLIDIETLKLTLFQLTQPEA